MNDTFTGLPLGPCFDDIDLAPWCLAEDAAPSTPAAPENPYQFALEQLHQLLLHTLEPYPSAHRAALDALRQWALPNHPASPPQPPPCRQPNCSIRSCEPIL